MAEQDSASWSRSMWLRQLRAPLAHERIQAVRELTSDRGEPVREALRRALFDSDPAVGQVACWALGERREIAAAEDLIKVFHAKDAPLRKSAAAALAKIGGKDAIETLSRAARDETSPVRAEAVAALGLVGDTDGLLALRWVMHSDEPQIRSTAVRSMGLIAEHGSPLDGAHRGEDVGGGDSLALSRVAARRAG
jgi:HEAT repeat protein